MKDPYEILGVKPADSPEDIKKAYRTLAKKYHPDNYVGNELADLAQEKMKEINEAYEAVTREGARSGNAAEGGWNPQTSAGSSETARIREALHFGRFAEAQSLLDANGRRDAEWHFLYGILHYRRGWYDEASRYVEQAASMEPGNAEYRQAAQQLRGGARGGFAQQRGGGGVAGSNCSYCDICAGLMCLDCMCDCC